MCATIDLTRVERLSKNDRKSAFRRFAACLRGICDNANAEKLFHNIQRSFPRICNTANTSRSAQIIIAEISYSAWGGVFVVHSPNLVLNRGAGILDRKEDEIAQHIM